MNSRTFSIHNPSGLHARPARQFADAAAVYPGLVRVRKGDKSVNGKSVLALLTLGVKRHDTVVVETDNDHSDRVLDHLGRILGQIYDD